MLAFCSVCGLRIWPSQLQVFLMVGGKRIQHALRAGTFCPALQAYVAAETSVNFTWLFQLLWEMAGGNRKFYLGQHKAKMFEQVSHDVAYVKWLRHLTS